MSHDFRNLFHTSPDFITLGFIDDLRICCTLVSSEWFGFNFLVKNQAFCSFGFYYSGTKTITFPLKNRTRSTEAL